MASSSLPVDTTGRIAPSDMNRVRTEGPARGADAPLIRLENVHFSYPAAPAADGLADGPEGEPPRTEALAGISLSVRPGEHLCILGGNGSGKSTLVQLMNALLVPTSGTVEAFGFDATTMEGALEIRRRAAMVFQHPDDQMVTSIVADDVAFGPENLGVPQPEIVQRVDAALEAVGMSALAQADPADLSGGQRQRVAIAGALAMQPRVLLLDEPSAMLDAQGHASVQRIVQRLNDRGIGIVHVTHFMDDALLADRVVVLREGTIALEGTPEEVFAQRDVLRTMGLEPPFAMCLAEQLAHAVPDLPVTGDAGLLAHDVAHRISEGANDLRATGRDVPTLAAAPAHEAPSAQAPGDAIVFDHVSFSYADEASPRRKRSRRHSTRPAPLALADASFCVPRGSLTALVGCTGSGKSTSVELACALKLPRSGSVFVGGIDTADLARRQELRAQIGYVSQLPERQLFAETVRDDVAFGPRNLHLSDDEVERRCTEALHAVGLDPSDGLMGRSPFALSGGQQRAVAIAGVLAMRTPILVLDEPMAGLDPAGRDRMRSLVQRLRSEGVTMLMVTHAMDDVAELADHVVVLDRGSVVAQGSPRHVFGQSPCPAPGLPAPLAFARELARNGVSLDCEPLTLAELCQALLARLPEVRHHGTAC